MTDETAEMLMRLNREFYDSLAAPFDRSRFEPQFGFVEALNYLPDRQLSVLDVGCGNGRFAYFMLNSGRLESYLGLDFSSGLLHLAQDQIEQEAVNIEFQIADIGRPRFLEGYGRYELVACLSAMHHIPQRRRRAALLREMGEHLTDDGRLLLCNWQFMDSERQRKKILSWGEIDLAAEDVESNDYLLSWKRGGYGRRYACHIDQAETAWLAAEAGLTIETQYREDGRSRDLTLYTLLKRDPTRQN